MMGRTRAQMANDAIAAAASYPGDELTAAQAITASLLEALAHAVLELADQQRQSREWDQRMYQAREAAAGG